MLPVLRDEFATPTWCLEENVYQSGRSVVFATNNHRLGAFLPLFDFLRAAPRFRTLKARHARHARLIDTAYESIIVMQVQSS